MTKREKIIEVINSVQAYGIMSNAFGGDLPVTNEMLADALIAAGIGDVSEFKNHRLIAEYSLIPEDDNTYVLPNTPIRVKQLYSGEEVEKIVKERDEYKHRAKIAEMTLEFLAHKIAFTDLRDISMTATEKVKQKAIEQAEKELAEGKHEKY